MENRGEIAARRGMLLRLGAGAFLAATVVLGMASTVRAAEFRNGQTVIVPEDEVIDDDLFLSGNRVEVNGTVKGDLFAVGATVTVNGSVEGSLFTSGQALQVGGQVDGSVYSAAYSLALGPEASVQRNVYFGGFSLTAAPGSAVGRGLYEGGYQAVLEGEIEDDVVANVAALEINGRVGGDVLGRVGETDRSIAPPFTLSFPGAVPIEPPGLRIGDEASIGGEVRVTEMAIEAPPAPRPAEVVGLVLWRAVRARIGEFIALIIVGALLLRFSPTIVQRVTREVESKPLPSAGSGCLIWVAFVIGVPILMALILLIAILGGLITLGELFNDILGLGGAALAFIVAAFTFTVSLVTKAVVSYLGGRWVLNRLSPSLEGGFGYDLGALALGVFIYEILRAIPLGLGWLISVIVTVLGLGAIYYALRVKPLPAAPEAPAETSA